MATYNNLTSLEGLQVGDVIQYGNMGQSSLPRTSIDFKGYSVNIKLSGKSESPTDSGGSRGGLAEANINTSLFPNKILTFEPFGGTLCYGDSYNKYTRIMVAGDSGAGNSYYHSPGGGLEGSIGYYGGNSMGSTSKATQTSGGNNYAYGITPTTSVNGQFGIGGYFSNQQHFTWERGGYGWYGGGAVGYQSGVNSMSLRSASGSGFIVGLEGTSYPSGYLSDDTALIEKLKSAITDGVLTQGGATGTSSGITNSAHMTVTILALPNSSSTRNIHYYNGTQFVEAEVYRYNGTLFERVEPKIYTNSQWQ